MVCGGRVQDFLPDWFLAMFCFLGYVLLFVHACARC